jgi:hypothetical protein
MMPLAQSLVLQSLNGCDDLNQEGLFTVHKALTRYLNSAVLAISALLAGCAAPRPYTPSYSAPTSASVASTTTHDYSVSAVDVQGRPVAGVKVDVSVEGKGTAAQTKSCETGDQGKCAPLSFTVGRDPGLTYVVSYMSSAKAKGTKDGYYTATTSGFNNQGSSPGSRGLPDMQLRMIAPADYLDDGFAVSAADRDLRERVMRFLEVIKLQSVLVDSEVLLKGIGTSEFKGKKYLRLRINSTTTYNSLKLNKYDMGKRLFDESVRKVLNPLNDNIAAPKAYYGYDIVMYGHTKSFADKDASATKVEYRFLLPEASVRRYKEKDISGQTLLDAGVVLMDDERVEFKLQ